MTEVASQPQTAETSLDVLDLVRSDLFHNENYLEIFSRLREEDPVHLQRNHPEVGSFWNVTRYKDILQVDTNHEVFSSEGTIVVEDLDERFPLPMFIATDPPSHDHYRSTFTPVFKVDSLSHFEDLIRQRTKDVVSSLPVNEEIDWVETVSAELTSQMLATLFDFPFEDRHRLVRWANLAIALRDYSELVDSEEQRQSELMECLAYFSDLRNQRMQKKGGRDLISIMAHSEHLKDMKPSEILGNLLFLIVAGSDTTRNSMTGGVWYLNRFPEQFQKLQNNHQLIQNTVSESIRMQSPVAYMRRTALVDTVLGGRQIRAGEKVLMWYVSGNQDESVFDAPDQFDIERSRVRKHMAFGFGIHRCIGIRLAEMQLRILWEEILSRFNHIEVTGSPQYINSSFIKGYMTLPVMIRP